MLGKLFKYDMKALFQMMVPLILSVLGTTAVGTVAIYILNQLSYDWSENSLLVVLNSSLVMLVFVAGMAITAFIVITMAFVLYRYYKNLFTDEGYLTFTLPVKPEHILLSKTAAGVLWVAIAWIVAAICASVMIEVGNGGVLEIANDMIPSYEYSTDVFEEWLLLGESLVSVILSPIQMVLMMYLSITVGSMVARRHKIWASIGIYFGISFGLSMIRTLFDFFMMSISNITQSNEITGYMHLTFGVSILLSVGLIFGSFFICRAILNRRLNLS